MRVYDRRPLTITLSLSALLLLLVWNAPFFRGAVIPYDYQTAHYPWYVDAVRAARYSPFCLYNPFNDAGQPTWNLFAFNDPIQWLPALGRLLPGYTALETLELAHLILIPIGLLLVAWANDVPRRRWIFVALISLAAFAMGPTLKYMQQSVGIVAYAYVVLLLGALEAFRRSGGIWFALLAGVSAAYVFEAFIYPAIFLPIALLAYAAGNWRELFGSRRRAAYLAAGLVLAVIVAAPALSLGVKIDHTIEIAEHLIQVQEFVPSDILQMLGAPSAALRLVEIPAALVLLAAVGFGSLTKGQRWAYGIGLGVLILYGFGDLTPFGTLFRAVYPLAELVRRPYATWYVVLPFLLVLATLGLRTTNAAVVRIGAAILSIVAIAGIAQGAAALAAGVVVATLAAVAWRPTVAMLALTTVVQWCIIDWIPFTQSNWQPQPIPAASMYLRPYMDIRQYLGGPAATSNTAFRIANIGLPAQFGPSAGMFEYYDVAADYNTFIPHELVREVGTDQLHAAFLPAYIQTHPDDFAGPGWERLATRYYLLGPNVLAALPARVLARKGLHVIRTGSYWGVVEDTAASPFVAGVESSGGIVPIDAPMSRDSFRFIVPSGVDEIRFAQNYDSWWHAVDDSGINRSALLHDDGGQLALTATPLEGRSLSVFYTNRQTTVALAISIAAQLALLVGAGATLLFRLRRSLRAPEEVA
jgi:hypothetical protein